MNFYYDSEDLNKCYSLLPLWGENNHYIKVKVDNLENIMDDYMPQVDIIKADIEGVWDEICNEILNKNIYFKILIIEFEIGFINEEKSAENLKKFEQILKAFKEKGYSLYLNRPRRKMLSEVIFLR